MTGAFWYLIRRSTRNVIRTRLRRMRQPRYAIASLFGLLYFGWVFGGAASNGLARIGGSTDAVQLVTTGLLFVTIALMWLWPSKKGPALGFTPAEVHYLFPAPISRSQLIWYRVARAQLAVLVTAMLVTLMARPSTLVSVVAMFIGVCVLFGTLGFHGMGVALGREHVGAGGRRARIRHWLPILLVVAVCAAIAAALAGEWSRLIALPDWQTRLQAIHALLSTGVAGVALWPIRALVRVPAADGWATLLQALPPAILVWGLNAIWVVRSDAAFEEASAEQSEKIARVLQGQAAGVVAPRKGRPWFALARTGRPETAILWKNIISISRTSRVAVVVGAISSIVLVVMVVVLTRSGGVAGAVGGFLMLAFLSMLNGPIQTRADLRQDLAHLATLKTWPIRGAVLVRGEILAPTVMCSAITSSLVVVAAVIGRGALPGFQATPWQTVSWTISAMIVATGLIAVQVVIQNAVAVMFPAWVRLTPRAAGSVEGMGRQMLMLFGAFLVLPIVAIPAGLAAGLTWIALQWTLGYVPVIMPAIIATAILLIECWIASELIGAAFDRTDVNAVDPA